MRRIVLTLLPVVFTIMFVNAQAPQFAVVRPDGTTYICPTFDSAYNKSTNGDNIYLPGGNFSLLNPISKILHIFGAGYNQDSSAVTNITTLNQITIMQGAEGGSIEGVLVNSSNPQNIASITFGNNQNSPPFSNYTIKYCSIPAGIYFLMPSLNITIMDNYIGYFGNYYSANSIYGTFTNSLISNNIITGSLVKSESPNPSLQVNNNIFFYYYTQGNTIFTFANQSIYQNNIFQTGSILWNSANSNFYNNTNGNPYGGPGNISSGTIQETWDLTFINPGTINSGYYSYDVHNNYQIKPASLCKNSGTDGTDRGIYGGTFPWKEGGVPSNPHIYFKQVAPQTNNGQLQIQFKVRTNN